MLDTIFFLNELEFDLLKFNFPTLLEEEFLNIFLFCCVAAAIAILIVSLSYLLAVQNPETEKLSTYECGFEPYEDTRHQFDVRFYLIAILFIVFDIEAVYLYPWCVTISQLTVTGFWAMVDFVFELGVGFFYVWVLGALDWD